MSSADYISSKQYLKEGLFKILGIGNIQLLGEWLKNSYVENPAEVTRMAHARELDEFYKGCGDDIMDGVISLAFKDQKNRDRRKDFENAGLTKFNNFIARIVREKATVYAEPARRKVADPTENERYQSLVDAVDMNGTMRELDRKIAYHEDALLWYRVRLCPDGVREPVLDVVSPASFWAICHPEDKTMLIGIIFDQRKTADPTARAFRVWTHDQTFEMNGKCEIFEGTIEPWALGAMPGVLCSIVKPSARGCLLAEKPSADLLSAQKAIRLQDLGLSKETVSANKQAYVSGDVSTAVIGQTADSEGEVILPEGVTVTTTDRGVDPAMYRENGDYIAESAGANHGVPPSSLHQRDASSGAEIELRRIPIRELRKDRIPVMRRIEYAIAFVMSLVNSAREVFVLDESGVPTLDASGRPVTELVAGDLSEMAFTMNGWSIEFGEVQQPLTAAEEDQVFDFRRQIGLTNTLDEIKRRNPDVRSDVEAEVILDRNIQIETRRVGKMKELMAMNGSMGASTEAVAGNSPTIFQANRGKPDPQGGASGAPAAA